MLQIFKLFFRIISLLKDNKRPVATFVGYLYTFLKFTIQSLNPLIFAFLIDNVLINGKKELILPIMIVSLIISLASFGLSVFSNSIFRFLTININLDFRTLLLDHIRSISISELEKIKSGTILTLLANDTAVLAKFLNDVIVQLVVQIYMLIFSIAILFYFNPIFGLLGLLTILLLFFIPRIFKKYLYKFSSHVRSHNEEITSVLVESIDGSRLIKLLGLEKWEKERNDIHYKDLIKASTYHTLFDVLTNDMSRFFFSFIIILMYWIACNNVIAGTMSIGVVVAAINYLNNALMRVQYINGFYTELQKSEVSLNKIDELLRVPLEIYTKNEYNSINKEPQKNIFINTDFNKYETKKIKHNANNIIDIRKLNVQIDTVKILKNINMKVQKGQKIAILGLSGSGKSTFYKIIAGLLPVESGEYYLFGKDIKEATRKFINKKIGFIFQEPFIFNDTIYENIRIGNLNATSDEIIDSAKKANLSQLISNLPDGINTKINYKGNQLSGGEKQRIALARIFLQKPEILILDEPTSALDKINEIQIMNAIHKLMIDKTTLISTHRLDAIKSSDKIIVIDNGFIVEEGCHEDLMANESYYYNMVTTIFQQKEDNIIVNKYN